jgi:hypothetical protein
MNTLAMAGLEAEVGVGDHQPHTTQPSLAAGPEELAPEVFIFGVDSQFDQSSPLSRRGTDELCAPALRASTTDSPLRPSTDRWAPAPVVGFLLMTVR